MRLLNQDPRALPPTKPDPNWKSTQAKPADYKGRFNPDFTKANAKILRASAEANGKSLKGLEAHHIVASTHTYKSAQRSRALLDKYQIDINSHHNCAGVPNAFHHGHGLHSYSGMDQVFQRLHQSQSQPGLNWGQKRQLIIDELGVLGDEMENELFKP